MSSHTPGPWEVFCDSPREFSVWRRNARTQNLDKRVACKVDLGDVSIIAAAPDLLAALEAIWPFVEEDDGGFATPQYQAAINQVCAAIAKARGK